MNRMEDARFQRISKALADPSRLAILQRVAADDEVACQTLVEEMPITQATISHHTRELSQAGLITMRRKGKCGFWRLAPGAVEAYREELGKRLSPISAARQNGHIV